MIPKSINDGIPQWPMPSNQFGLHRYNQVTFNAAKDHKLASKITDVKINSLLDAPRMLLQSLIQDGCFGVNGSRCSPSWWHGLTHIDWLYTSFLVQTSDPGVELEIADVVKSINSRPEEPCGWR
jgi:hypothetical protein